MHDQQQDDAERGGEVLLDHSPRRPAQSNRERQASEVVPHERATRSWELLAHAQRLVRSPDR